MKKIVAAILCLVLCLSLFTACGEKRADAADVKSICVIVSFLGDGGFSDLSWAAVQRFADEHELESGYYEYGYDNGFDEWDCLRAAVKQYDMIVVPAVGKIVDALKTGFAKEHSDKLFVVHLAEPDETFDGPNILAVEFREEEYSYLAGFVAAKMSRSGVLGFLSGAEGKYMYLYLPGFIEGALSARPDIKVVVDSVGNYYDTYKTKEKALALLDQGADVLFETCSGAGIGVLEALDEQSGLCIGSTYNWRKELAQTKYESLANHFLTLGTINCDVAIYDILHKSFSEANIFGKRYSYGAAEGVCVLVDDSEFIAAVGADLQREYTELLSTLPADIPTVYNTDMSEVDALINSVSLPGDTQ